MYHTLLSPSFILVFPIIKKNMTVFMNVTLLFFNFFRIVFLERQYNGVVHG